MELSLLSCRTLFFSFFPRGGGELSGVLGARAFRVVNGRREGDLLCRFFLDLEFLSGDGNLVILRFSLKFGELVLFSSCPSESFLLEATFFFFLSDSEPLLLLESESLSEPLLELELLESPELLDFAELSLDPDPEPLSLDELFLPLFFFEDFDSELPELSEPSLSELLDFRLVSLFSLRFFALSALPKISATVGAPEDSIGPSTCASVFCVSISRRVSASLEGIGASGVGVRLTLAFCLC